MWPKAQNHAIIIYIPPLHNILPLNQYYWYRCVFSFRCELVVPTEENEAGCRCRCHLPNILVRGVNISIRYQSYFSVFSHTPLVKTNKNKTFISGYINNHLSWQNKVCFENGLTVPNHLRSASYCAEKKIRFWLVLSEQS